MNHSNLNELLNNKSIEAQMKEFKEIQLQARRQLLSYRYLYDNSNLSDSEFEKQYETIRSEREKELMEAEKILEQQFREYLESKNQEK